MYLLLGTGAGFLSGLLGAGGGLIMVPGLIFLFQYESMNPAVSMHVAVGTSLAAMIPVALRSLTSHMEHEVPFYPVYKLMAPGIILGVIIGGVLAHFIRSHYLEIVFGIFVFIMALGLLHEKKAKEKENLPGVIGMSLAGGFVGVQSGMLGVAGSAFSVPFLTYRGVSMHTAVVVSVAIAMTVSVLGTLTFIFTGMHVTGLPHWSTGYIYWPAWLGLSIGGVFVAPLGAKLSHRVSARKLKVCFALFLFCISAKMLW
ncbi:MAG: sulfite exporter TauE/SafE family protein [Gammaproteobacteria bacterium]|nr:sulfite exporter TauE/SafE family protein [Gammaproteobacteria bacterium]